MSDLLHRLKEAAQRHGTDKGDEAHSFAGRSYLDHYARYLARFDDGTPRRLMELGVLYGASLRMWCDVFPSWEIVGVDVAAPARMDVGRAKFVQLDQADPFLATIGEFDVIVDDCGHFVSKVLASFSLLRSVVKPGGVYVIEDSGMFAAPREGLVHAALNPIEPDNSRSVFNSFLNGLSDDMDVKRGRITGVHRHCYITFIEM